MKSTYNGECVECGQAVYGNCSRELSSAWELQRDQGGGNAVRGPNKTYTGRVMHPVCHRSVLFRERSHIPEGQASLLG